MFTLFILLAIIISGLFIGENSLSIQMENKNQAPTFTHPFGTDWLGRDMLARTIKGLTLSIGVGILAAFSSAIIALFLGLLASWNNTWDRIVTWLVDLFLSIPHIVLLILIAFTLGGGFRGVVIGLALTHWPSLTRVLRSEMLQIKSMEYVEMSRKLGKSKFWVARHHFIPHLLPQLFIGFLLLFPHAILHEAAITFLGFGLPPEQPAIGIILSESMRYLSIGMWWLAFFPGLALLIMVGLFDWLGKSIQRFIDPFHGRSL
ncbi:ABC transporter permease [Oceanobacillus senegalensis]|uniref:ABC transporter permease n=1 Tax=Oceanobacillus senegalensis TaxID=1936063 RepID=UPI000A312000|nr:ABC transporter permease [Oceanobacillus senegalensis]